VTLVGLAEICGWVPVPASAIVRGEPEVLLVIDTLPVTAAALVGAKVTVKVVAWLGLSVWGDNLLMLKPVPVMLLAVMETAAVPGFVTVIPIDALAPIGKLPKLALEGLALSAPPAPVPLREIPSGEFDASLMTVSVAVSLPSPSGAN